MFSKCINCDYILVSNLEVFFIPIDKLYNSGYTWKQILDLGHTLSACVKYRDDIGESTDETILTTLAYHIKENMPASTTTNFKINGADIGKYFN